LFLRSAGRPLRFVRCLYLRRCRCLSSNLVQFLRPMSNLRHIEFYNICIGKYLIKQLISSAPLLESLELKNCGSDEALQAMIPTKTKKVNYIILH
jgi:hypothetical protein